MLGEMSIEYRKRQRIITLASIGVLLINTFHMDIMKNYRTYKVESVLECSPKGFYWLEKDDSILLVISFIMHMMMIVMPIRGFIAVFYKIPLKHNFFECVDFDVFK